MGRVAGYLAILVFPLSACTDTLRSEGPLGPRGLDPAGAEVMTENVVFDVDILEFVPCANGGAGEVVQVSGRLHDLFHTTVNGNRFMVKVHTQPQGVEGVGLTTGSRYRGTGVTQEQFGGSFVNGQFSDTFVNNYRIIGPGPGNNLLIHELLHVTVNANGDIATEFDHADISCK